MSNPNVSVQVSVRMRPLQSHEKEGVIQYNATHDKCFEISESNKPKVYKEFQDCFLEGSTNLDMFKKCIQETSCMEAVASGRTGCVFTYGHTGSGKTHTVFGSKFDRNGMYSFAGRDLCEMAKRASYENHSHSPDSDDVVFVGIRFYQLYQGKFWDLLSKSEQNGTLTEMQVREGTDGNMKIRGPAFLCPKSGLWRQPGLTLIKCTTIEEIECAVKLGLKSRTVGSSGVHDKSSRSHVFLEMQLMSNHIEHAESILLDKEAAVFPLGHAAASEQFRFDDHCKLLFKKQYSSESGVGDQNSNSSEDKMILINGLKVDISSKDGSRENGAVKNFERDDAFSKFKISKKNLLPEEGVVFDPEGYIWNESRYESKLILLEHSVDMAEKEVTDQQLIVENMKNNLKGQCIGGLLIFVDLAGNEAAINISRPTPEQRTQIAEQKEINKSLFVLKECIRGHHQKSKTMKGQKPQHIAFRGSRLTMVLKEHLLGKNASHLVMIANVSPNASHLARTKDTLAYAALVSSA